MGWAWQCTIWDSIVLFLSTKGFNQCHTEPLGLILSPVFNPLRLCFIAVKVGRKPPAFRGGMNAQYSKVLTLLNESLNGPRRNLPVETACS